MFLCVLSGFIFTYFYFLYTHEYPPGSYKRIAVYEADKVFQTRLLITEIANLIVQYSSFLDFCFSWILPYPMSYEVILQMINVLFLSLLLFILPFLMKSLDININKFLTLLTIIPISWNYIFINGYIDGAGLYYPYDIPSLTFFAIGILLFLKNRWLIFYPVFIFACLNRESACFISLAGFVIMADTDTGNYKSFFKYNQYIILHVSLQALIWILTRIVLCYIFRNNPGDFFETPHSMIEFLFSNQLKLDHWAGNPYWFLTLFAGIGYYHLFFTKNSL